MTPKQELQAARDEFAEVTGWYGAPIEGNRICPRLSAGQVRYLALLVKADKKDHPNR